MRYSRPFCSGGDNTRFFHLCPSFYASYCTLPHMQRIVLFWFTVPYWKGNEKAKGKGKGKGRERGRKLGMGIWEGEVEGEGEGGGK
jgi:hypothetical protein